MLSLYKIQSILNNLNIPREYKRVIMYPELNNIKSLDQIPGFTILLYPHTIVGNKIIGHWTLLTVCSDYVEFFDSFSFKPDFEDFGPDYKRLTRLFKKHMNKYPNINYEYNNHHLQNNDSDYCGWWCLARIKNIELSLDEFSKLIPNDNELVSYFIMK